MPLGHRSAILFRNPDSALLLSTSYFFLPTFLARAHDPENRKAAKAFMRPGGFSKSNCLPCTFFLSHPKGIERRLVDRRCRVEPVIGLVGGERLAGQRPEQSIHVA